MKRLFIVLFAILITACSTTAYEQYSKSTETAYVARSNALRDIAVSGDSSARVAAVMALALGGGAQTAIQAPPQNEALQWASILVPGITQVAGMRYQHLSSVAQSSNAAAVAISTNQTMAGIAGNIQAPGAVTNNTLSGTGTLGSGAYTTTDNHTVTPAPVVTVTPVVPIVPVVTVTPVVPIVQSGSPTVVGP